MAAPNLKTNQTEWASGEDISSAFSAAAALNSQLTVPTATTRIMVIPSAAAHFSINGTPTSTFGQAWPAGVPQYVAGNHKAGKLIGDAGAITLIVVYGKPASLTTP